MKKRIYLLAACALIFTGCSQKPADPTTQADTTAATTESSSTAGTQSGSFTGKGTGYGGEVQVAVTFDGGKITDFEVVSGNETSLLQKRAVPILKERILKAQTPVVDSVSGATFTSFAVKTAIADAAKQAGQDFGSITMTTQGPETERRDLDPVETQLVIVGGGPAGLAAAITAKESGLDNIIVVEKLDILSGNGKFDMNFYDMINSQAQKEAGINMTVEDFIEEKQGTIDSPERVKAWAEGENTVDAWLRSFGAELNQSNGGTNHMAEKDAYAGEEIQDAMEAKVKELGIDVRTGTKGLDLIMEDKKVIGVKVQHKNDYYDIMADAVIMATGGFSCNKELLAKYAPGTEVVATSNQMGATGDFVPVFEKYGFKLENMDVVRIFKTILKPRRDLTGAGDGYLLVNKNGERFIDESKVELEMAQAILAQPEGKVFYIYDQNHYESSYRLEKHNELGYHIKADTLDELADKLGIPAVNLKASVETYNKAVNGEEKDPFREKPYTTPLNAEGPFYAAQVESGVHMTKGGVAANEKGQILDNDGNVVNGIYAAGEVASISGGYSASVVFGRISGEEAAKEILAQ